MSLYRLIAEFLRRHWAAYALSALMLVCIALLIVWIPRQIGHVVDGLVANQVQGPSLLRELAWLAAAGLAMYGLRVGWRLKLYATAYRLGGELREQLYARLTLQGADFYQHRRTGNLMALPPTTSTPWKWRPVKRCWRRSTAR